VKTGLKGVVTENWGLKVVSLLIASLLWLLVVSENQSEEHFKASLSLVNIPEELVITGGVPQYINVRIVGPRTIVSNVRQRKLGVTLDLGGMQSGTSTYEILPKRFAMPHGVEVIDISPSKVTLQSDKKARKMLRVKPRFTGTPKEGFEVAEARVVPEEVEVEGAERALQVFREIPTEVVDIDGIDGSMARETALVPPDPTFRLIDHQQVKVEVDVREMMGERAFTQVVVTLPAGRFTARPAKIEVRLGGNLTVLSRLNAADILVTVARGATPDGPVKLEVLAPEGTEVLSVTPEEVLLTPTENP
jgi:YbbR domain-containing protein